MVTLYIIKDSAGTNKPFFKKQLNQSGTPAGVKTLPGTGHNIYEMVLSRMNRYVNERPPGTTSFSGIAPAPAFFKIINNRLVYHFTKKMVCMMMLFLFSVITDAYHNEFFEYSQENNFKAFIQYNREDSLFVITALIRNNTEENIEGSYSMIAVREGASGRSLSSQSGEFSVDGGRTEMLSRLSVNIGKPDACKVVLCIIDGDILLSSDTLRIGESSMLFKNKRLSNKNITK